MKDGDCCMISARTERAARWLLLTAVCLWCAPVYAEDGAAKVITLNGQVSVLRDDSPWVLNVGDSVAPSQIIVTGADGFAVFQVADGSTFEVFPNSRVVFRNNPGSWRDLIDLFLGRVKVHIQKLGGQPNYNRVRTPTAVISVRGTVFDVAIEDQDDTTLVSVEEGQVGVRHLLKPGPEIILNQGESIRVFKNQPLAASNVDKSSIIRGILRQAEQALYEVIYRGHLPGGGTSTGCPTVQSCDTKTPTPPGTTPPPAPPTPPH